MPKDKLMSCDGDRYKTPLPLPGLTLRQYAWSLCACKKLGSFSMKRRSAKPQGIHMAMRNSLFQSRGDLRMFSIPRRFCMRHYAEPADSQDDVEPRCEYSRWFTVSPSWLRISRRLTLSPPFSHFVRSF